MRCRKREKWSMMTRMTVLPRDSGKSVTKFRAIWDQGRCGMGSGISFPVGNVLGTMALAQEEQEAIYFCTSDYMLGHQYLAQKRLWFQQVPGCPVVFAI